MKSEKERWQLCFVRDNILVFTNDLKNTWGDDWDDSPAYCNAGWPIAKGGKLRFMGFLDVDGLACKWERNFSMERLIKDRFPVFDAPNATIHKISYGDDADFVEQNLQAMGIWHGWLK